MKTFFRCTNNGVTAVVSQETFKLIRYYGELTRNRRAVATYPTPIFTFTRKERAMVKQPYVTGDYQMMDALLADHIVVEESFYVPFSNHMEINGDAEQRQAELRFCATFDQMVEEFGIDSVMKAAQALVPLAR